MRWHTKRLNSLKTRFCWYFSSTEAVFYGAAGCLGPPKRPLKEVKPFLKMLFFFYSPVMVSMY